jgi:hypothetical protein
MHNSYRKRLWLNECTVKFEGPWFATQTTLATSVGFSSFIVFCYCRTRWPLLFAPRTKLKGLSIARLLRCIFNALLPSGFSPHEAHAHTAFFGWIWPTLKTSEYTVLQIVGLDAAVVCDLSSRSALYIYIYILSSSTSTRCPFTYFAHFRSLQSLFSYL